MRQVETNSYFAFGMRRLTFLMMLLPLTSMVSASSAFERFEVWRRRWLFPPLVRTSLPEPVNRKRLEVALWVLSLIYRRSLLCEALMHTPFQKDG